MPSTPNTENKILHDLIQGDANAFKEVYNTWHLKIFNFAFYLTKSRDLAEETTQEVFIKLWERREKLRPDTTFQSYLRKLAQNHVIDTFRKANTEKELQKKIFNNMAALHQLPADTLLEKQLTRLQKEAIDKLPPQQKIIYTLSRDHEMTYEQIAEHLGLSRNTVRNHMSQAIQSVKGYVGGHTDLACLFIAIILWESKN